MTAESKNRLFRVGRSTFRAVRVTLLALALTVGSSAFTPTPVGAWNSGSFSVDDEALLFSLTNQARASAGLPALRNDTYLHNLARWRSKDMYDRNYFSHNIPPSGEMVFAVMQRDGYCFKVAGENIGVSSFGDDVATARIQTAFMNSPSHRENILGNWNNMGIGAYKGASGKKLYTVLFSQPCGATAPKATPKPTPKPTSKPTPKATPKPTAVAANTPAQTVVPATPRSTRAPSAAPTAQLTPDPTQAPTATATATLEPTPVPTDEPAPTLAPSPSATASAPPSSAPIDLRVHTSAGSSGLLDSTFGAFFGDLFGW